MPGIELDLVLKGNHRNIRGLFGKFVEFGHKNFKYQYNPFIL